MPRQIEDWMRELSIDDLPPSCRDLARVLGVDAFLRLSAALGGCSIYVPKIERLTSELRDERIRKEFTGDNHRELALRYNLSERHVRNIVHPQGPGGRQLPLFDGNAS